MRGATKISSFEFQYLHPPPSLVILNELSLGEYFFPRHFKAGFQRVFEPFLRGFLSVSDILKGFKAFQSSRNCFKYFEKQIGFSHGNLYNLHLLWNFSDAKTWLSTRNRIFSWTPVPLWWKKFFQIERASISITWNRGKCDDIHTCKKKKTLHLLVWN